MKPKKYLITLLLLFAFSALVQAIKEWEEMSLEEKQAVGMDSLPVYKRKEEFFKEYGIVSKKELDEMCRGVYACYNEQPCNFNLNKLNDLNIHKYLQRNIAKMVDMEYIFLDIEMWKKKEKRKKLKENVKKHRQDYQKSLCATNLVFSKQEEKTENVKALEVLATLAPIEGPKGKHCKKSYYTKYPVYSKLEAKEKYVKALKVLATLAAIEEREKKFREIYLKMKDVELEIEDKEVESRADEYKGKGLNGIDENTDVDKMIELIRELYHESVHSNEYDYINLTPFKRSELKDELASIVFALEQKKEMGVVQKTSTGSVYPEYCGHEAHEVVKKLYEVCAILAAKQVFAALKNGLKKLYGESAELLAKYKKNEKILTMYSIETQQDIDAIREYFVEDLYVRDLEESPKEMQLEGGLDLRRLEEGPDLRRSEEGLDLRRLEEELKKIQLHKDHKRKNATSISKKERIRQEKRLKTELFQTRESQVSGKWNEESLKEMQLEESLKEKHSEDGLDLRRLEEELKKIQLHKDHKRKNAASTFKKESIKRLKTELFQTRESQVSGQGYTSFSEADPEEMKARLQKLSTILAVKPNFVAAKEKFRDIYNTMQFHKYKKKLSTQYEPI